MDANWIGPLKLAIFVGQRVSNPAACAIIDHIDPGPESMEQLLPGNTLKCGQVHMRGVGVEGIRLHLLGTRPGKRPGHQAESEAAFLP